MDLHRAWFLGCCILIAAALTAPGASVKRVSVSAPAFAPGNPIPAEYAYKGPNVSPELLFKSVPANARSLALIVDDPDAPAGLWTHWVVWNLPSGTTSLTKGKLPPGAVEGKNSFGDVHYDGPVPPSGTHRYFFHLYALDTTLSLEPGSDRAALTKAMTGHIVGTGETYGVYSAAP